MIDEKKLIEDIKGWQEDIHDNEYDAIKYDFVFDRIYEMVEEQPKVDVPDANVGGWIPVSERLPSKEECEKYRRKFLVTVNAADPTTMEMKYVHTTVRGKEVERWEWKDSISPWDVKAWQPLPEPFKESDKK